MPISVTCPSCNKRLTLYDSQAGTIASCPFCTIELHVPRRYAESITTTSADQEVAAQTVGDPSIGLGEMPVLEALPADEPSAEEALELGSGWRQVESALGWVDIGVSCLMFGLGFRFIAMPLGALLGGVFLLLALLPNLIVGVGAFILFFGQLFCLRVPAGTRARPAAALSLLGRVVSYVLTFSGAFYWLDAEATQGSSRDTALLTAFALLLGGSVVAFLAEFSFAAFLKRVGLFLEDKTMMRHARWAGWIIVANILAALVLGTAGIALTYQSVLQSIAEWKAMHPKADPQPLSWLLTRIADMFFARKGLIPDDTYAYLAISAVGTFFWIALGTQYRAAVRAASATIKAGLKRNSGL